MFRQHNSAGLCLHNAGSRYNGFIRQCVHIGSFLRSNGGDFCFFHSFIWSFIFNFKNRFLVAGTVQRKNNRISIFVKAGSRVYVGDTGKRLYISNLLRRTVGWRENIYV